jgi:hypothetical protein
VGDATGDGDGELVGVATGLGDGDALGEADALGLAEADGPADAAAPEALAATDGLTEAIGDSDGRIVSLDAGDGVAHAGGSVTGGSVGLGVSAPPWPNAST